MQIEPVDKNRFAELIEDSRNIAIIPSKVAGADSFAAAVGLYYMMQANNPHATKTIKLVYTGKIPEECKDIITEKEIDGDLAQRDLLVRIDYSNTPAAKVSYTTEDDVLLLRLGPVAKDFDTDRVKAKVTGFDFDLVITIGARELEDLGPIYNNLYSELQRAKVANLDNTNTNKRYGILNIIDTEAESLSMLVFKNMTKWGLKPNKNSAQALLAGMTR